MPKVIARQGWAPKKAERYLIWEVSLVLLWFYLVLPYRACRRESSYFAVIPSASCAPLGVSTFGLRLKEELK